MIVHGKYADLELGFVMIFYDADEKIGDRMVADVGRIVGNMNSVPL